MPAHNILVVVVDGLRASALGSYGNTSFPTPTLDRFATDSLLFDWCYGTSPDLAEIYRALWHSGDMSLPRQIKSLGYGTTLVTDDPVSTKFSGAAEFDTCMQIKDDADDRLATARAKDAAHTAFARIFATAADVIASTTPDTRQLVWVHSRGMYGPWDAPLDMQESLLDENDPPPVEEVTPPDLQIAPADDPDAAFRFSCAYAAQAMVLDECWETLLSTVESAAGDKGWLVLLMGARGFPLGEHRRVGGVDPRLYGEQLHVPWIIRWPDAANRLVRDNQLTTHADLSPLVMNSLESSEGGMLTSTTKTSCRDTLEATGPGGDRAIRTREWCLRQSSSLPGAASEHTRCDEAPTGIELFVRPDDRWEANDVAKLCPDVVESLVAKLSN